MNYIILIAGLTLLALVLTCLGDVYLRRLGRRDGALLAKTRPDMKVLDLAAVWDRDKLSGAYLSGLMEGWRDAQ